MPMFANTTVYSEQQLSPLGALNGGRPAGPALAGGNTGPLSRAVLRDLIVPRFIRRGAVIGETVEPEKSIAFDCRM